MTELEWMDIFANNLVDILKDANMTQRELADAVGVTEATISRYIGRQRIPSTKNIINIAHVLDCDINDLIDFGDMIY